MTFLHEKNYSLIYRVIHSGPNGLSRRYLGVPIGIKDFKHGGLEKKEKTYIWPFL